jgi:hypothetical protein
MEKNQEPLWWVAVCDRNKCQRREPLLRVSDVSAIAWGGADELYPPEDAHEQEVRVVRAVAVSRGWTFGTHVGEPDLMACPSCSRGARPVCNEAVCHG